MAHRRDARAADMPTRWTGRPRSEKGDVAPSMITDLRQALVQGRGEVRGLGRAVPAHGRRSSAEEQSPRGEVHAQAKAPRLQERGVFACRNPGVYQADVPLSVVVPVSV